MIIRSKAPLRISFGGGGTDVSPYIEKRGGVVINSTIDKYAYVTLIPHNGDRVNIESLDYQVRVTYHKGDELEYDGKLDLVKAAMQTLDVKKGFDLVLHCDAPPGAGLGSSSTMTTAIVGAFRHWMRLPLTEYETAELAYKIERIELGIKGGKQDQYACTFGGINFIEFFEDGTIVNPLRIRQDIVNELEYRLVLCYTGRSRLSSHIIEDQVGRYLRGEQQVIAALDKTRDIAIAAKRAMLLGNLDDLGNLLHEGWCHKKNFSNSMSDDFIDRLYQVAKENGAIGGKLLGAGGGGHMLFLCDSHKRNQVIGSLSAAGATITPFAFETRGLQTWEIR